MIIIQKMILQLITFCSGLIHGPLYLKKNGFGDFGDFILMLLILTILNKEYQYLLLPGKFLEGSVKKITMFLMAFPILSKRHSQIFLEFKLIYLPILTKSFPLTSNMSAITQQKMRIFIRNWIRVYFSKQFENPHDSLKKYSRFFSNFLPVLLTKGLQSHVSPHHCGRKTTSSVAKMFIVQHIVGTMFEYLHMMLGDNLLPMMIQGYDLFFLQNQGIELQSMYIAFWMLYEYRENKVFSLYMNTILSIEYLGNQLNVARYDAIMNHADLEYRNIIMNNFHDYEEWIKLHEVLQTNLGFSFPIYPKYWKTRPTDMISWILNTFQNERIVGKFCESIIKK